jgi:hypothetical protein
MVSSPLRVLLAESGFTEAGMTLRSLHQRLFRIRRLFACTASFFALSSEALHPHGPRPRRPRNPRRRPPASPPDPLRRHVGIYSSLALKRSSRPKGRAFGRPNWRDQDKISIGRKVGRFSLVRRLLVFASAAPALFDTHFRLLHTLHFNSIFNRFFRTHHPSFLVDTRNPRC